MAKFITPEEAARRIRAILGESEHAPMVDKAQRSAALSKLMSSRKMGNPIPGPQSMAAEQVAPQRNF